MQSNKSRKRSTDIEVTQEFDINSNGMINKSRSSSSSKKSSNNKSSKKNVKKKNPIKSLFKKLISIIVGIFVIYSLIALLLINKVDKIVLDDRVSTDNELLHSLQVKNILLVGTDGRTPEEQGRSDSMVLISINSSSKEIIMTSFMRDIYVDIPNYHYDKLNASYSYGGVGLLLDTIEENFSIQIDDCLIIDFTSFVKMVDAIGGVNITVSDEEANAINDILISEVNEIMGDDRMSDLLSSGGDLKLNGKQALSYSRIRYVGNADFERTQRQRTVINAIIDRLKTPNIFRIGNFANATVSEVSSNMSSTDMYQLSLQVPFVLGYDIVQQRIPADDTWYYDDIDGQSVIVADFQQNNTYLSKTIYKNTY